MFFEKKKAQTSLEFLIVTGIMLLFFSVFFLAIQEKGAEKSKERKNLLAMQTAMVIQEEMNLASQSSDGYTREFEIPLKIADEDYEVSLTGGMVYIKSSDNKTAVALPVPSADGGLVKGKNIIQKQNDLIHINIDAV